MFGTAFATRASSAVRYFSRSTLLAQKSTVRPSPKEHAIKDPKILLKREMQKKAKQKRDPNQHPLYMDIPTAMKYMRASEVGRPAKRTTVTLQLVVLPEKSSRPLQGVINFPKPVKFNQSLIFTADPEHAEQLSGNQTVKFGGAELINAIKEGEQSVSQFTQCFATPEMVPLLRPIARTLGVKGLMPSVKKGTVSEDVLGLLNANLASCTIKQKNNLLVFPVGRCDFSDEEIIRNIKAASEAVYGLQPPGTKNPNLIGQCTLSSTQGPSVIIDFRE